MAAIQPCLDELYRQLEEAHSAFRRAFTIVRGEPCNLERGYEDLLAEIRQTMNYLEEHHPAETD
jgi:hypothetical protein